MSQTLWKAIIASALSDLISPACTKLDKVSMSADYSEAASSIGQP